MNMHPSNVPGTSGPDIRAPAMWSDGPNPGGLLGAEDRELLSSISTIVRYNKGETIHQAGTPADAFHILGSGVAAALRPGRTRHIVVFFWPGDLIGHSQTGKNVNTVVALTPLTLFKMTPAALEAKLRKNSGLAFQFITKLSHGLRETQHHAFLLGRRRTVDRLALFIQQIEARQNELGMPSNEVYLPMSRIDIAAYIGVSAEAVTRAFRDLKSQRVIRTRGVNHVEILNRRKLDTRIANA